MTPEQRIRGLAFNALTGAMDAEHWWLPLSERQRLADAVVDAIKQEVRAAVLTRASAIAGEKR